MRKIFEQLKAKFKQFLKQRDTLLLLVPCEDSDVPLLLHALREVDRESGSDVVLLFAGAFHTADQFLNDTAQSLSAELELTNDAAGPEKQRLPSLPEAFLDCSQQPAERLESAMVYARSLVDPRMGQHFLWGMGPSAIDDADAYYALLATLPPRSEILPWMRGARIVARVSADFQLELSPLASAKRVEVSPFSILPNAQEEELLVQSSDAKAPMSDRMQAEVQLAYLDYAHGRFDEAIARFSKALAFFQWAEISVMEGLVICGLGDVARRQENWQDANHWYQCAVVPASKSGNPMLMSTIVQNLAVVAFHDQRFGDAEERYSELVTLKRAMLDENGLAEALEWQGISQEKQLAYDRAVISWEESALIAKAFELQHRLPSAVANLKRGYQVLDMPLELESFDSEWALQA